MGVFSEAMIPQFPDIFISHRSSWQGRVKFGYPVIGDSMTEKRIKYQLNFTNLKVKDYYEAYYCIQQQA